MSSRIFFRNRRDIDIVAVVIDEGEARAEPARLIAERLEIPLVEKRLPISANACGGRSIFGAGPDRRREFLMALAQEMEAGVLATGHNLDDEATDVFISYLRGELNGLLAPGSTALGKRGKSPG